MSINKNADKTILVLGGGIGGITVASLLRKKLLGSHRVILAERESNFVFAPSFLWLMTGLRKTSNISRPLSKLESTGIELIRGEISKIDPEQRSVQVNGADVKADYLVIALGAELIPETVPGLVEAGHNLYTLAGAEALRDARLEFRKGHLVVLVSGVPFKCPAAPYEAAMLLESDCRQRNVRDSISIDLFTPEPGPMGVAGPEVSGQVRQMVESKDVHYYPEHTVTRVEPETKRIIFSNGTVVSYDFLVYVPPHRAPQVVIDADLTGSSGWVPVDRSTLETRFPGVYAIGDVTDIPLTIGKPLPKAGVFAHGEAEVVANNLAHVITNKGRLVAFDGGGECFVEIGDGQAGFGSGNFFAEPSPQIKLQQPSRMLHLAKVAFEKYWLFKWF